MRREHAVLPHLGQIVERLSWPHIVLGEAIPVQQIQGEKRRMPFVQVIGMKAKTHCVQQTYTAQPEYQLLLQSVLVAVAVEIMGQFPVFRGVLVKIRIEQQNRRLVAVWAGTDIQPGPDPYRALLDPQGYHRIERRAELQGIPPVRLLDLLAAGVDLLPEIPRPAYERNKD